MNPFYNILAKLNAVTSTTPVETAKPTETVYESVEARGSITEAVRALEAKFATFKESVADDIADKKAEKEAGDWWGDKKASLNKDKREVKGSKYGGSKQKDDDEAKDKDDKKDAQLSKKSNKTAILDKDDEDLDEGIVDAVGSRIGHAVKGAKRALAGKPSATQVQQQHAIKARAGQVNLGATTQQIAAAPGEEKKAERTGKVLRNVSAQQAGYKNDIDESFEFGSKNFKNASNLKKAPKAKLVKESAVRNHPIYTNPEAWDHYKKELDEEELNNATQELDEISKLAGLPKQINVDMNSPIGAPAKADGVTLPPAPIEQEPMLETMGVMLNGNEVNVDSIEVDGVNDWDRPDFADAYITYAEYSNGTPMTDDELVQLENEHGDLVNQAAHDSLQGSGDFLDEDEMEEGNEFSGALASAKATGAKDFEVAGKKYTVKEDINVSVTANGEEDALNLFRKLAGMPQIAIAQHEEEPIDGAMEIEVDEERDPEYVNSPREQVAPISAAIPSGNDLHGAKRAYKISQPGDNPMAVAEAKDTSWDKYTSILKSLTK
jgi:hypothetical protein